jgi:hypothetical protein
MKKLAIYYGYPSTVNDYTINGAVDVFKVYDLLVFGKDLEKNTHPDHNNTELIINHQDMANTEVYGYIDTSYSNNKMKNRVNKWKNMCVAGIFINLFGYDFGTTREQQNTFVDYIHNQGLKVFVNSWNPDDALSNHIINPNNVNGLSHHLLSSDWYLAESFAVKNNEYDDIDYNENNEKDWIEKGNKILNNYSNSIQIASIATINSDGTATDLTFSQNKADYSYYAAHLFGFNAWGFGENNYSSLGGPDSLPYRMRKELPDYDYFKTNILKDGQIYERRINVGIHIDTINHTVSYRLD